MSFDIKIEGLPNIKGGDLIKALDIPKLAEEELNNARARMLSELLRGHSPDGSALKPYSASYIKQLKESGEGTTVDLLRTGGMHQSIQTRPTKSGAESFAQGQHRTNPRKTRRVVKESGKIRYLKKTKTGKRKASGGRKNSNLSNAQLVAHLEKDRPFFGLGPKDLDALEKRVSAEVDRVLKDLFK